MQYSPIPKPASVRAALRGATDGAHQRMHGLEPFQAIADGTLTAERYPRLLQSLLVFHSTIGCAARQYGWADLSSASARADLLREDVRGLGGHASSAPVAWQLGSAPEALGALYAAEGSIFGGRVIAGHLDYLFGSASDGRRFFIGTAGDGTHWRTLLAALEEHCAETATLAQAVSGAILAFDLFESCVMLGLSDAPAGLLNRVDRPDLRQSASGAVRSSEVVTAGLLVVA